MKNSYSFDLLFVKRFGSLCAKLRGNTLVYQLFFVLLLVRLLQEYVYYRVGLITSEYYKVLGEKDLKGFLGLTVKSLLLFALVSFVKSSTSYLASIFYIICRKVITEELHDKYFIKEVFYYLNTTKNDIDNPDQRIAQDVDKLCSTLSNVLPMLLISPFTIAYYSYMSYSSTGWIGPVSVFIYFIISTIVNKLLMSPVVAMVYLQEKFEGYFRFQHMHVRTNAEAIAFQNGEDVEHSQANKRLKDLIETQERLFIKRYPLDVSVNLFNYFGSIISFLVLSVPIFAGFYDEISSASLSELISKNTFVTMYLISCFSNLVNLSEDLTNLAGSCHRVAQIFEYAEKGDKPALENPNYSSEKPEDLSPKTLLQVRDLNVTRPQQDVCVLKRNLNFKVEEGSNLLIMGKSGIGKTSIFRALAGLWKPSFGEFTFYIENDFNHDRVLFLSQKPLLLPYGTLREQIFYPKINGIHLTNDQDVNRFLELSDLLSLRDRLKSQCATLGISFLDFKPDWNWYDALSPGEMQRVSFMRVFCHRPKLAFLDESLSAVSSDIQVLQYALCDEMKLTLISIGHDELLKKYHPNVILLDN